MYKKNRFHGRKNLAGQRTALAHSRLYHFELPSKGVQDWSVGLLARGK